MTAFLKALGRSDTKVFQKSLTSGPGGPIPLPVAARDFLWIAAAPLAYLAGSKPAPSPAPPPTPSPGGFTGVYSTSFGTMVLKQNGNRVTGCYTHDKGTLTGTVSGNVLSATWKEAPHKTNTDRGGLVYTKTSGGFTGRWNYDRDGGLAKLKESASSGGKWTGTTAKTDPPCTP